MATIRIMLVDDHPLMREGLRAVLESEIDMEIVAQAVEGHTAVAEAERSQPDIVIMDIAMQGLNGLESTRLILSRVPQTRVIILSMHTNAEYVEQALRAGASGYLVKHGIKSELILAIRSIYRGDKYLTSSISSSVIDGFLSWVEIEDQPSPLEILTSREQEILKLLAEGSSSQEIAQFLTISAKTVDRHRANIMEKLDIHNIAGLVRFAIKFGLINLDD